MECQIIEGSIQFSFKMLQITDLMQPNESINRWSDRKCYRWSFLLAVTRTSHALIVPLRGQSCVCTPFLTKTKGQVVVSIMFVLSDGTMICELLRSTSRGANGRANIIGTLRALARTCAVGHVWCSLALTIDYVRHGSRKEGLRIVDCTVFGVPL
jgi:hypothetical protein